ncbi:hypothetical protein Ae201684_016315 [Aphanomyces euteiches]|uniref:DDE-1 domain-containing protein n=1 Tax=Aphanomyces euteiches TaxID=100861 RepID=A0A6G0WFE5_9STRA|nr:hypothetical protein Ae201684_016315 [Aphanomyces euteiches]
MDGGSSHLSERIVETATQLQIILLCLPSNATHLIQPLDICVFSPFKRGIRRAIYNYMIENDDATTIPKSNALEIASCAWKQHIVGRTVVSGFSEAGLWPVDHAKMSARLAKFKEGGLPSYLSYCDFRPNLPISGDISNRLQIDQTI